MGAFDLGAGAGLYKRNEHDGIPAIWNFQAQIQVTWWPGKSIVSGPP
jgi:hypothetical protein